MLGRVFGARFFIVLSAVLALGACQAVPPAPPLAVTYEATNEATKNALVTAFSSAGYQIRRDSQFQLVFDKPNTTFAATMLYGSNFNGVPNSRVTLTITNSQPTRVNVAIAIVTNPGSGFENASDFSQNPEAQAAVSSHLERARAILAQG
ncbi:hypothetical protein [Hoeflea sp.]|uniref:hypothetical protein n=1 Tax=Hoeflea sp. TaxID=1940281 RepID=UPI003B51CD99